MTDFFISPASQLTIESASKLAKPGDIIHLAPGNYRGDIVTAASGTASAPITYVSDVPGAAKINISGSSATGMAWWNKGSNVIIKGVQVDGSNTSWRFGFYGTGSDSTVINSIVHDILSNTTAFNAAQANGAGGAAIEMDNYAGATNSSVIGNLIYNIGPDSVPASSLVHGIYQITSGNVLNNVAYNVVGSGITLWHGAKNINIANNTIDGARNIGIVVGSGDSGGTSTSGDYVTVENNIVTNSRGGIYEAGVTGIHNFYKNNLLFNDRLGGYLDFRLQHGLTHTGTVFADPKYVNAAAHDYRLLSGSPAIDTGTSIGAPSTDFSGVARPSGGGFDIGSYESSGTSQPPPPVVTSDTLVLLLSEDRYKGDAKFIAKVDGTQIAGPTAVTILRSSSWAQTFTFSGMWSTGSHDLEIDFINDLYAKGVGHDRNLYVEGVKLNGSSYLTNEIAMKTTSAIHIQVG
jgi:Ca-dependent carbohydrate-binding module xylan-binding/Disaggregatase related